MAVTAFHLLLEFAFIKDEYYSRYLQQLKNREIIANRLAELNPYDNSIVDSTGYPLGYQHLSGCINSCIYSSLFRKRQLLLGLILLNIPLPIH